MISRSPTLLFAANSAWNLAHFRAPLLAGFKERGFRLAAAVPHGDDVALLEAMNVDVRRVHLDRAGTSPLRDLRLLSDYVDLMRDIRPDAFLGFTAKPNVYGAMAARWHGVPAVLNISGLGTSFLGGRLLERVMAGLYRAGLARAATVFFQNEDDEALFLKRRLVQPAQARRLPGSGVDLVAFAEAPMPTTRDVRFLLVARMLRDKGVVEFVEAARRLRGASARFQLLGPADDENRSAISAAELRQWVDTGVVEWLGPVEDVRSAMHDAHVIVLPSYREGMPRTLLEAAAIGRPVIATDVPGCRQAVRDGETGLLCAARDPASLAEAMRRLLDAGPARLSQMGAANRRRAESEFGQDQVVALYLEALAACGVKPAS